MTKKIILLTISLVIVSLVTSYVVGQFVYRYGKVKLDISLSPKDAKITINSESVKSNNTYLKPGSYVISVVKEGYLEYRKVYDINQENNKILVKLEPKPEGVVSSLELGDEYNKVIDKYPITKKLPYSDFTYTINYRVFGSVLNGYKVELVINSSNAIGRKMAIQEIKKLGYNPIDYKIEFINFENEIK